MDIQIELKNLKNKLANSGIDIGDASIDDIIYHFEDSIDKEYKKKHGVVYTPEYLAKFIAYNAIDKWIQSVWNISIDQLNSSNTEIKNRMDDLKILDPCTGAGVFIFAIIDILIEIYERLGDKLSTLDRVKYIIENNIYAIDMDKNAIEIVKFRLWAYCTKLGYIGDIDTISNNVFVADALTSNFQGLNIEYNRNLDQIDNRILKDEYYEQWIESWDNYISTKNIRYKVDLINIALEISSYISGVEIPFKVDRRIVNNKNTFKALNWYLDMPAVFNEDRQGFDIIVGNPPYVSPKDSDRQNNDSTMSNIDIYAMFYEKLRGRLSNPGIMSFINPVNWTKNSNYTEFRQKMMNSDINMISAIEFRNRIKVFSNALATVGIYTLSNSSDSNLEICKFREAQSDMNSCIEYVKQHSETINRDELDPITGFIFDKFAIQLKNRLNKQCRKLKDIVGEKNIFGGVTNPDSMSTSDIKVSWVKADTIDRWGVSRGSQIIYLPQSRVDKWKSRMNSGYFCIQMFSDDFECIWVKDAIAGDATTNILSDRPWIYALFNSEVASIIYKTLYYRTFTQSYARVTFLKNVTGLCDFVIPNNVEILNEFVNQYVQAQSQEDKDSVQTKLELKVQELYGLTDDELEKLKNLVGKI